jgi:general secretion pathway protein F
VIAVPVFRYKATSMDGELVEGQMEEPDRETVIARIQASGRIPIQAEPVGSLLPSLGRMPRLRRRSRVGQRDLVALTRELSSLLHAGLPLDRALQIMHDVSTDKRMRGLIGRIGDGLREGDSLSESIEAQRDVFSAFYVSMVRAAEASGELGPGLARLGEYLERSRALREKAYSAMIYPALLVAVAAVSLGVILAFVVPKITVLFADLGAALPFSTRVVIGSADLVRGYWWLLPIVILALATYVRRLRSRPASRLRWDRRLLRLPLAGSLLLRMETARLTRSLGTLLANGLPLLRALAISRETLSNRYLAEVVGQAGDMLKEGGGFADTLMSRDVFPRLAVQMIKVGEETGRLEEMLLEVADVYDRETSTAIQRLLSILEPVLIVGLGIVIGGIIMSILVAIVSVNDLPV